MLPTQLSSVCEIFNIPCSRTRTSCARCRCVSRTQGIRPSASAMRWRSLHWLARWQRCSATWQASERLRKRGSNGPLSTLRLPVKVQAAGLVALHTADITRAYFAYELGMRSVGWSPDRIPGAALSLIDQPHRDELRAL